MIVKLYRDTTLIFQKDYPEPVHNSEAVFNQCVEYLAAEQVITPDEMEQFKANRREEMEGGQR